MYNSLAVWASLNEAGVDMNLVSPHFATFTGMGRRFQKVGEFTEFQFMTIMHTTQQKSKQHFLLLNPSRIRMLLQYFNLTDTQDFKTCGMNLWAHFLT